MCSLLLFCVIPSALAEESISFTIPENSIQIYEIPLESGFKIEYFIELENQESIDFYIETPDKNIDLDTVNEEFDSFLIAESSGIYKFIFDNTETLEKTKELDFVFNISKIKYDIFIDKVPETRINIEDLIQNTFDFWKNEYPNLEYNVVDVPQDANLNIQFVKNFGTEHVGYALGTSYMEVGLGDDRCRDSWQPYSEEHVLHIMRHEMGHILGFDHHSDPENIMFSASQGKEYDVDEEYIFSAGYGQFVPFCTDKEVSAFSFRVETDDPVHGFEVYTIPSGESFSEWSKKLPFPFYSEEDCRVMDSTKFFGECHGVTRGSGLLVVTDKEQSKSLTKINILTKEISSELEHPQDTMFFDVAETDDIDTVQSLKEPPSICGPGTTQNRAGKCIPIEPTLERSNGGGCLIATATYGTELAPQVQFLREIRDNTVMSTSSGTTFMTGFNQLYYSFSPTIADMERENPMFQETVRAFITPMISTLSIMTLADNGSELEVLGLGISVIALNLGMYIAAPIVLVYGIKRKVSFR